MNISGRMILRCSAAVLLALFLFTAPVVCARADEQLTVSLPETVRGYTPCGIRIVSPGSGEAVLRLLDHLDNCWLIRRERLSEGENLLSWDGLGTNQERLFAGPYHFEVVLRSDDGGEWKSTAFFDISGTTPALVYALPSSGTLYLDGSERWFTECYVSAQCLVMMEVRDGQGEIVFSREADIADPDGESIRWNGVRNDRKKVSPGSYTVTFYSKPNPDYRTCFSLEVAEENPLDREVKETGPVIPERGMSDEEIWALMMKPSVVIAAKGASLRFDLYETPRVSGRVAGTLCCATQGLEVLEIDGAWARVAAWSHTDGRKAEGYIQTKRLTVAVPGTAYGVLVDKREQTLTVFENGKRIGTVPVSTGLPVGRDTYRETPAGAFLTDVHFGASFAQDGFRYEYPLRYDGGNIIHSVGYTREGRVRDYSSNLPLLGKKASHGCVRVSPFAGEDSPLNMYWLWTHLPYHTRVIILDD